MSTEYTLHASARGSPPVIVIDLVGGLTATAESALDDAYAAAGALGARAILLNFEAVDYLNSAGVACLIRLMSQVRGAGQHLAAAGLSPHYRKIFQMMGLSHYAPVYDNEQDARADLATRD